MNEKKIEQVEEKYYNNLLILLNHKKVDITAYNILKKYDIKTILHNEKYIKKLRNDFIKSKYKDLDNKEFINIIEKNYYNQINKGQFMENLKYYSDLKGITPSKMAKKLDIPISTVFDWYNGVNFPKVCHLYFLVRELNVTYQDLLTDNKEIVLKDFISKDKIKQQLHQCEKVYKKEMEPYQTEYGLDVTYLSKKEKEELINKRNCLLVQMKVYKKLLEE